MIGMSPPRNHCRTVPFVATITAESLVMKIILYILGFFALIGFLLVAGCFKMVF